MLARIAKLVSSGLRTEDSIGRANETTFIVISNGAGAAQVLPFARRLHEQLKNAQVAYRGQPLKIVSSFGVSSVAQDTANSIEDLVKLALQRLQRAGASKDERIVGGEERTSVWLSTSMAGVEGCRWDDGCKPAVNPLLREVLGRNRL